MTNDPKTGRQPSTEAGAAPYKQSAFCIGPLPGYAVVILLLWGVLVLPSVFLNGPFHLDVGGIFSRATQFPGNIHTMVPIDSWSGRCVPFFWLYYMCLHVCFSSHLAPYYLIQNGIFLAGALLSGYVACRLSNKAAALLFGLLLFLCSPNPENLYTIGKPEPLVFFFLAAVLSIFSGPNAGPRSLSLWSGAAVASLFTLGLWSKETAITLFGLPVLALVLLVLLRRFPRTAAESARLLVPYGRFLGFLAAGLAASKLPSLVFGKTLQTGLAYTTYKITLKLIADNIFFYVTQQPDVVGFGIFASAGLVIIFRCLVRLRDVQVSGEVHPFVFAASLLGVAWAYMAILVIWRWPMGYYPLVPAIIFRLVAAYVFHRILRYRLVGRVAAAVSGAVLVMLLLWASAYIWYIGSSQVVAYRVYDDALRRYISVSRPGDQLTFESYPFFAEQVKGTEQVLETIFHEDRHVFGVADLIDPAAIKPEILELLHLTEADLRANEKHSPKKGEYVMTISGNKLATWQARSVAPTYGDGSYLYRDGSYDMQLIAEDRVYSSGVFLNIWTLRPQMMSTYLGYELYKIVDGPRFTWRGRYPDTWMGRTASLTLYPEYVNRALLHLSTSKYNPQNAVSILKDGELIERLALKEGEERTVTLTCQNSAPAVFRFEVERTFVPKEVHMNRDTRELGVIVRLEPFAPGPR
jgi:hypothetical protein